MWCDCLIRLECLKCRLLVNEFLFGWLLLLVFKNVGGGVVDVLI